jgi:hypothetical protein
MFASFSLCQHEVLSRNKNAPLWDTDSRQTISLFVFVEMTPHNETQFWVDTFHS